MKVAVDQPDRTVSVIVPCHHPTEDERASIAACLRLLEEAPVAEVCVVEQVVQGQQETGLQTLVRDLEDARFSHFAVPTRGSEFHRTRLCNEAALRARGDYLWLHDGHLMLPFPAIATDLARIDADAVKPFATFVKLSSHDSIGFREAGSFEDPILRHGKQLGKAVGKTSIIVDREVFIALRGLQERFIGPSEDGFELVRRMKKHFRCIDTLGTYVGVLLHRTARPGDAEALARNNALRAEMAEAIENDVDAYMESSLESRLPFDRATLRQLVVKHERARAVAVTHPTPPPRRPARLPGELWGLTTYFNPSGYATKRDNYRRFRQASRSQGLRLLTVELAFEDRPFELTSNDADRLIQLRSDAVLWHKERLLTLGLGQLPEACDKVAWLDADVLFENPDWVARTADELESFVMVQPFSMSVRLDKGETRIDLDGLPIGSGEHEVLQGMAFGVSAKGYGCLARYVDHGHSGYAWAGRREVLERHGYYEANILGNGDLNIALAMYGGADYVSKTRFSDKARRHLEAWARRFFEDVQGSVGFVEGTVHHLWHGNKRDRLYDVRLTVLKDHDFDPDRDLGYDDNGVLCWAVDKPGLRDWCARYFDMRKEG
jgi:hypothetical protein